MRQIFDKFFLQTAASYCASRPQNPEASQVVDMAICCRSPDMLLFYDNITDSWNISQLVELDIYHHSQHFSFIGSVFVGHILPCLCKRVGTSPASCKVPVHQRNRFLLLLAGKFFSSNGIRSSVGVLLVLDLLMSWRWTNLRRTTSCHGILANWCVQMFDYLNEIVPRWSFF